ncbi:MAG: hypothetical protein ACREJ3_12885 [Polyangiaceae bacterium]
MDTLSARRSAIVAVALVAASTPPRTALAQPSRGGFDLTWNAPPSCPARDVVLAEMARALGINSARTEGRAQIDVTEGEDGRWRATLQVQARGGRSERVLEADRCDTIAAGSAVVLAVAVGGGALPLPLPQPAANVPPPAHQPQPAANVPPPERRASAESQMVVGVSGVMDDGTMPSLAPGIEASLGWGLRHEAMRLRIVAEGALYGSQMAGASGRPGEGGTFTLWTGAVRGCETRVFGPVELGPCLGVELDAMSGAGIGAATPLQGSGTWGAVDGSALAVWNAGRAFGFSLRAGGVLPWSRPSFVIDRAAGGDIPVHRPALLGLRIATGIEVRFF